MRTMHWHNWTPQEDRLIVTSTLPDKALARRIGCTQHAIHLRRYNLTLGHKPKVTRLSTKEMAQRIIDMRSANAEAYASARSAAEGR